MVTTLVTETKQAVSWLDAACQQVKHSRISHEALLKEIAAFEKHGWPAVHIAAMRAFVHAYFNFKEPADPGSYKPYGLPQGGNND